MAGTFARFLLYDTKLNRFDGGDYTFHYINIHPAFAVLLVVIASAAALATFTVVQQRRGEG